MKERKRNGSWKKKKKMNNLYDFTNREYFSFRTIHFHRSFSASVTIILSRTRSHESLCKKNLAKSTNKTQKPHLHTNLSLRDVNMASNRFCFGRLHPQYKALGSLSQFMILRNLLYLELWNRIAYTLLMSLLFSAAQMKHCNRR